jgi:ribonuclease HII
MRLDETSIRSATVAEIEAALARRGGAGRRVLALLEQDPRAGVRRIAVRERGRFRARQAERRRARSMRDLEERFRAEGARRVAGVDEVGRGCLAGPVVACAVVLPEDAPGLEELDDSKVLDRETRERLRERIVDIALDWSVAAVDAPRIDEINILEASMEAMRLCLADLDPPPDRVLVDGNRPPASGLPETTLVDGDARSLSIAAASVVAKVHRDALMREEAQRHPGYGFERHKGYASAEHRAALERLGPCPLHRRSFSPLAPRDQLTLDFEATPGTGASGEALAEAHLAAAGYEVLDRGYRGAGAEIDLVVRRGDTVVFVEVKSSRRPAQAAARVDAAKRRHLARAARHYIESRATGRGLQYRFDVIEVVLQPRRIEHIEDAFEAT